MHTISFYQEGRVSDRSRIATAVVVIYTVKTVRLRTLSKSAGSAFMGNTDDVEPIWIVDLICAENGHGWTVARVCDGYADAESFASWVRGQIETAKGGDPVNVQRYE